MTIRTERGLFWRLGEPDDSVSGGLLIDEDGNIFLDLDGYLTKEKHALDVVMRNPGGEEPGCIVGTLREKGDRVLLWGLRKNGGSAGILTFQGLRAENCLIGREPLDEGADTLKFSRLEVSLKGFEQWLRIGSIKTEESQGKFSAAYEKPEDTVYQTDNGTLTYQQHFYEPGGFKKRDKLEASERGVAFFQYTQPLSLEEMRNEYDRFNDLMLLLVDSSYRVEWPFVHNEKGAYRWYFNKMKIYTPVDPPRFHESWTAFSALKDIFGEIWKSWKKKREDFGPGLYLFLGTKRGFPQYLENRFITLVSGLESLHRRMPQKPTNEAFAAKIARILACITTAKDKKWLEGRFEHSLEPSLQTRLEELFGALPLNFDTERLENFAKACADRRNDTAHHGGLRTKEDSYSDYLNHILKLSNVLSTLYHARLLQEVGVPDHQIKWWVYDGTRSHEIKYDLVAAGLLDKEILKAKIPVLPPKNPDDGGGDWKVVEDCD